MPRLLEFFAPLFSFGLALDAAIRDGTAHWLPAAAQDEARALLERARAEARAAGKPPAQVESASFAIVAWFDEIMARNPSWADSVAPLQLQLFNSTNAHSEFFHHLSALQAGDDEVREVYWHALVHGFKGQYYFETGDEGELGRLKRLHGSRLPAAPLPVPEHGPPRPALAPAARRARRWRAGLTAGVFAMIALAAGLWLLRSPREAAPTTAQRIEQQLQAYACADLAAEVDADGTARVNGFVSQAADLARVQQTVAAMPGVKAARFDLQVRPWPHCEVVAILKPYQTRNRDGRQGLAVSATARDGRLREGDGVQVQVQAPGYDSHLWVDYYTADGAVMHFSAGRPARVPAGAQQLFGADIPSSWLVSPPFGTVMVTALASSRPFGGTADRPPFEMASDYLLRLRETLAANQGGERLVAEFIFLQTVER